jgi:hypothetical protein
MEKSRATVLSSRDVSSTEDVVRTGERFLPFVKRERSRGLLVFSPQRELTGG